MIDINYIIKIIHPSFLVPSVKNKSFPKLVTNSKIELILNFLMT